LEEIHTNSPEINACLRPGRHAHLIGIGGVSMSALAEVLAARGLIITGSDMQSSETIDRLRALGLRIGIGHTPEAVHGADCVIRTAAAREDNPEVMETRRLGLPLFERAQAWGHIMRDHAAALCIAGTHGKTTATSMAAQIALAGALDPTVMIGGTLPAIGAGHRVGDGRLIIMEACEYCNSFLNFSPTIAVVLNIEEDHLDCFADLEEIVSSFTRFALLTPEKTGLLLLCADDPGAMRLSGLPRTVLTFGQSEGADVYPEGLTFERGYARFDIMTRGRFYASAALGVPGAHNVTNALGAAAAAWQIGLPGDAVTRGLETFRGAARRFELTGDYRGATVVDDYAHHPTEIAVTLAAARGMGFSRVLCAFQPHTYSRTAALFPDFVAALGGADRVYMAEIYAAREKNTIGISARRLAEELPNAAFFEDLDSLAQALAREARPGDLILTMGAGDIWRVARALTGPNAPTQPGGGKRGRLQEK
jgi:UDP-N-acetylmuramate--alanine ligase